MPKKKVHYEYTHTRLDQHNHILQQDVDTISGYTAKEIKHRLVRRLGLQAWEPWTCLADGTYQRIHIYTEDIPYRGIITVRPIHAKK